MWFLGLIALPALEIFVFIEVGLAIGWLYAVLALIGTSILGVLLLRVQGRAAVARVNAAVAERRGPGTAVLDGALGFLGAALLSAPGFITDALGALLLLAPVRRLVRGWLSHHYAGRVMSFASAAGGRFAGRPGAAYGPGLQGFPGFGPGAGAGPGPGAEPADVEGTAVDDGQDQLGR